MIKYLVLAAVNRCVAITSKARFGAWYSGTVLGRLCHVPAKALDGPRFWDAMDKVPQGAIESVEAELSRRIVADFDLDLRTLCFDCTNFDTYITLVFDKGNNSRRNLVALSESPYHVIGSLVPSQHKDLLSVPLQRFGASEDARLAGVTTHRTTKVVHGTEWTVVVTRIQSLLEGQLRGIAQHIAKRKKRFLELRERLRASQRPGANKGGGYTRASLLAHAEKLCKGQYVKHILDVEVRGEGEKLSIFFRQKRGALERLVQGVLGKRIVFTDNHEWSTDEIVLGYRSQHHVEAALRQMKDRFHVSFEPVRHWTDQQIRVHALVCVLALTLASVLRREVARAGTELTVDALLDELQGIEEVVNLYPAAGGGAGRPRARRVLTRMSPLQTQLFESLDLGRFHRP